MIIAILLQSIAIGCLVVHNYLMWRWYRKLKDDTWTRDEQIVDIIEGHTEVLKSLCAVVQHLAGDDIAAELERKMKELH